MPLSAHSAAANTGKTCVPRPEHIFFSSVQACKSRQICTEKTTKSKFSWVNLASSSKALVQLPHVVAFYPFLIKRRENLFFDESIHRYYLHLCCNSAHMTFSLNPLLHSSTDQLHSHTSVLKDPSAFLLLDV